MLTFVVGTRPEAIKVAPVVKACQAIGLQTRVIHTGQHTDLLLGTGLIPDISLPHRPIPNDMMHIWIDILSKQLAEQISSGWVVVQGDTLSAAAGSFIPRPIYHIEAGIRSGNLEHPWPEEGIRTEIDQIAQAGACATSENRMTMLWERPEISINWFPVTGNPGIDALYAIVQPYDVKDRDPIVLVTLHRRESWGDPMKAMAGAINILAHAHPDLRFVWPAHPSPAVQDAVKPFRPGVHYQPTNVRIHAPWPHEHLVRTLARCTAVITDSGGIQEEAAALGIPCVVCREVTDRPESVQSNQAIVVGRDPDRIIQGFESALTTLSRDPSTVFGDGQAAPRIAAHLASLLD